MSILKYFLLENKLYGLILLNSSGPVDIVNEGGGEMKSNEEGVTAVRVKVMVFWLMKVPVTLTALMQISSINHGKITRMATNWKGKKF